MIDESSPAMDYSKRTLKFLETPTMQQLKEDDIQEYRYLASMHNANASPADISVYSRSNYMQALEEVGDLKVGVENG